MLLSFLLALAFMGDPGSINPYAAVAAIPLPPGYHRVESNPSFFAGWLRKLPLKKDRTVHLYDGSLKRNQDAQFAVLDISVGHRDLQQCADAVMRLRAEYLYAAKAYSAIDFYTEQGVRLNFQQWSEGGTPATFTRGLHHSGADRASFDDYLSTVFTYCSTRTLAKQLIPKPLSRIIPGDVFIHSGAPGHAMLVIDVAEDTKGHRIFLLAQSYMPAQDIHIVKNPSEVTLSPWFRADPAEKDLETPEWRFKTSELRSWSR